MLFDSAITNKKYLRSLSISTKHKHTTDFLFKTKYFLIFWEIYPSPSLMIFMSSQRET